MVVEALPVIILCCPIKVFHLVDYQHMFPKIFNFAILKEMAPILLLNLGVGKMAGWQWGRVQECIFIPIPIF